MAEQPGKLSFLKKTRKLSIIHGQQPSTTGITATGKTDTAVVAAGGGGGGGGGGVEVGTALKPPNSSRRRSISTAVTGNAPLPSSPKKSPLPIPNALQRGILDDLSRSADDLLALRQSQSSMRKNSTLSFRSSMPGLASQMHSNSEGDPSRFFSSLTEQERTISLTISQLEEAILAKKKIKKLQIAEKIVSEEAQRSEQMNDRLAKIVSKIESSVVPPEEATLSAEELEQLGPEELSQLEDEMQQQIEGTNSLLSTLTKRERSYFQSWAIMQRKLVSSESTFSFLIREVEQKRENIDHFRELTNTYDRFAHSDFVSPLELQERLDRRLLYPDTSASHDLLATLRCQNEALAFQAKLLTSQMRDVRMQLLFEEDDVEQLESETIKQLPELKRDLADLDLKLQAEKDEFARFQQSVNDSLATLTKEAILQNPEVQNLKGLVLELRNHAVNLGVELPAGL